jgi:hypothetical protein
MSRVTLLRVVACGLLAACFVLILVSAYEEDHFSCLRNQKARRIVPDQLASQRQSIINSQYTIRIRTHEEKMTSPSEARLLAGSIKSLNVSIADTRKTIGDTYKNVPSCNGLFPKP